MLECLPTLGKKCCCGGGNCERKEIVNYTLVKSKSEIFKMGSAERVLTVIISILLGIYCLPGVESLCKPLSAPQNARIQCNNDTIRIPTIAYTCVVQCNRYYISRDSFSAQGRKGLIIRCGSDGKWTNLQEFQSFNCVEDCGRRPLAAGVPLVVHGVATNASSWPWHAAIYKSVKVNEKLTWIYICGGSLVRGSVILTAAHCLSDTRGMSYSPDLFRVILGAQTSNYSVAMKHKSSQAFDVKQIYISPSYDTRDFQSDISLVQLEGRGVQLNDHVLPICLPHDGALDLNAINTGRSGDVVGFGVDETGNVSNTLKHAELTIASHAECYSTLRKVVSISQFCGGNKRDDNKWVTVCNGDSGGGFVAPSSVLQRYYIHGIVSTGDQDSKKKYGTCQSHVVFTRTFQFIFWIRDILERINGEIIRELASGIKYPYIQHGTETGYTHFSPIPRHWDNLVTTIELSYINIEPDVLFKSLEQNTGVEWINLTNVKFTKDFGRQRVTLPHLKSFVLDIPTFECWKDESLVELGGYTTTTVSNCIPKVPTKLSKQNLKAMIFFDKINHDWPLEKISHLGTNIDLSLHTARLIRLDHAAGKLVLNIPFCSEVLLNLAPDFKLRYLALSKCELDLDSLLKNAGFAGTQSLVLDNIKVGTGQNVRDLLSRTIALEHLVVSRYQEVVSADQLEDIEFRRSKLVDSSYEIHLANLPQSLKTLSLSSTQVEMGKLRKVEPMSRIKPTTTTTTSTTRRPSKVSYPLVVSSNIHFPTSEPNTGRGFQRTFPDRRYNIGKRFKRIANNNSQGHSYKFFPKLERFSCNLCSMSEEVLKNFHHIFQNVRRLLFLGSQPLNVSHLVQHLPRLQSIILKDIEVLTLDEEDTASSKWIGLEDIPLVGRSSEADESSTQFLISKRPGGRWIKTPLKISAEKILFGSNAQSNFWTSFEEFESDARLTSFEKTAYATGNYKFSGRDVRKSDNFLRLPRIPAAIRNNLKSVQVEFAEVVPNELLDSLNSAFELEELSLKKVRLLGFFINFIELPNLKKYYLDGIQGSDSFLDQTSSIYGVNFYVPFSQTPPGDLSVIKRFDNVQTPDNPFNMQRFEVSFDDCKVLSVDHMNGTLISTPHVGRDILPTLNATEFRKIAVRLTENELTSLTIPLTVQHLNLRCKAQYEWKCSTVLPNLLVPLASLIELRLALHHAYEEHDGFNSSKLKLSDLRRSAAKLEFLGLDEAKLQYSPNIYFPKLKGAIFETCTFDEAIVQNFFEIFQTRTIAILSYGYDKFGPTAKSEYARVNEQILLAALRNRKVQKIYGNLGSADYIREKLASTETKSKGQTIWKVLRAVGVPDYELHEFVVERNTNGKWARVLLREQNPSSDGKNKTRKWLFDMETHVLRGDSTFGNPSCIHRTF